MASERPSTALLLTLVASVLLAGWVYGRPLITGSDDPPVEADADFGVVEPDSLGFTDDRDEEEETVEPWTPPAEPRDPFLPVDLGATTADVATTGADVVDDPASAG